MNSGDSRLLSQTGPGTVVGKLLRSYWLPALLSQEIPEPDGAPVRVELLGENLLAFRATSGRVGLIEEHCSHRGASLYYGRIGDDSIRCWYHGWRYDVEGHCLETPNEPAESRMHERIRHPAYPCFEKNGVVWAYLGPKETRPEPPQFEWLEVPEDHVFVSKRIQQCHWTQGLEGDIDPSHLPFLHASILGGTGDRGTRTSAAWLRNNPSPRVEIFPKPAGLLYASRRVADDDSFFWRIGQWFIPVFTTIPASTGTVPLMGHAWVPMSDTCTMTFTFSWHPQRAITEEEKHAFRTEGQTHAGLRPGSFQLERDKAGEYADPAAVHLPQPWMRITRFQDQDIAATESIGASFDRARENLGSSDSMIARVRQTVLNAAQALAEGREPPGRDARDYRLRPVSVKLPRSVTAWPEAVADAMDTRPETFIASA